MSQKKTHPSGAEKRKRKKEEEEKNVEIKLCLFNYLLGRLNFIKSYV